MNMSAAQQRGAGASQWGRQQRSAWLERLNQNMLVQNKWALNKLQRGADKFVFALGRSTSVPAAQARRAVVPRLALGFSMQRGSWIELSRGPFRPKPKPQAVQPSIKSALRAWTSL